MPTKCTRPDGTIYYKTSYENKKLGIPRTRANFDTRKEAKEWEAACRRDAKGLGLGNRRRRLWGEALIEYLEKEERKENYHKSVLSTINSLRMPVQMDRRFFRLEDLPIEPNPMNPDELWIVTGLTQWVYDLKQVLKRAYLHGEQYHLRADSKGRAHWYHQPKTINNEPPGIRYRVTDPELLSQLETSKGRGPYSTATLRRHQLLVNVVLKLAWKKWHWTSQNYSGKIMLEPKGKRRKEWANYQQFLSLLIHAPVGLDCAILAAVWVGWRRNNLLSLEWPYVQFPVYQTDPVTGEREKLVPGVIGINTATGESIEQKNGDDLAHPISPHLEQLLKLLWESRRGITVKENGKSVTHHYVFHREDGNHWGDFRKTWGPLCKKAGLPENFHWHSLRRTFATYLFMQGADERQVQELGGWRDKQTMNGYRQMSSEHLLEVTRLQVRHKP